MPALTHFSKIAHELFTAIVYLVGSVEAVKTSSLIRSLFLEHLPVEIFTDEAQAVRRIKDEIGEEE